VTIEVKPGYAGFVTEIDGRPSALEGRSFRIVVQDARVTLVTFGPAGRGLTGLRRRGLIADSPRILARDDRAARPPERG
jgi:NAD+ kinase